MKYYFFIRLVSYEYKLQQIIKITIIHKIEKIRKKYTRCTCTISVSHESWWACNDVWLFDNFCQAHWSINYINAMIWKQGLISFSKNLPTKHNQWI